MIFHASVPADDPARVAAVMAEILGGEAFRIPFWPGGCIAMAGDARNTTIEVYPRDRVVAPGDGDGEMSRPLHDPHPRPYGCFHLAVASDRTVEELFAIGEREGWRVLRCSRGGIFDVIEFWLENAVLVEVLTPEMQTQYLAGVKIGIWKERLAPAAPAVAV